MNRLAILAVLVACGGSPKPQPMPAPPPNPDPAPEPSRPQPEAPMQPTFPKQTATPQELTFPEEDFRTRQPVAGPPRPFKLPKVKPFPLENGIKVWLVEQHTLPIVSIDLHFDGGSLTDPKGKEGRASVCMAMLTEGTAELDKIQYAEALADVASNINAYATDDSTGVTMSSLTKHFEPTYNQFLSTIMQPGFRASDFDRLIKRRIESVRQSKGNPQSVAGRVSGTVLYGPAHPFGTVLTEDSLKAITIDDCKSYLA